LSPTDAGAAFESGDVDAWVIWVPFYADAQLDLGARVLVDGFAFYVSTRIVEKHYGPNGQHFPRLPLVVKL
jgi:ABC-type nitrate/sulfonate/bicarbonate transport system substrate-binding protein